MSTVALPLGEKRISANSGCGPGRLLDGVDDGQAAQLAAGPRGLAARREAGDVGQLERGVHVALEVAAVVGHARARSCRASPRPGSGSDPAQLEPVDAELAGRVVDQPLDARRWPRAGPRRDTARSELVLVSTLGTAHVRGRERVDADQRRDVAERGEQIAVRRDIGADVGAACARAGRGSDPGRRAPARPR